MVPDKHRRTREAHRRARTGTRFRRSDRVRTSLRLQFDPNPPLRDVFGRLMVENRDDIEIVVFRRGEPGLRVGIELREAGNQVPDLHHAALASVSLALPLAFGSAGAGAGSATGAATGFAIGVTSTQSASATTRHSKLSATLTLPVTSFSVRLRKSCRLATI